MKIQYNKWIELLNNKLIEHNQNIRVIDYSSGTLTLSNGKTLQDSKFDKFKKRVMNKKTTLWVSNMDNLLNDTVTEKEIKSKLAAIGGLLVQEKYGENIRLNLNTGRPWNKGTKGQNIGKGAPRPQSVKDKISEKNSGEGNGMYGVRMTEEDRQKKSTLMKQKILAGDFTPNSNNRNTHWDTRLNNKSYRSSWEALYQYINPSAEYEALRIEYDLHDKRHVYIVDFVDHANKLVVEVKPKELCVGEKFDAKISALNAWASNNNYKTLLVNKKWLQEQIVDIDYSMFDTKTAEKIKALYETN
jgi:hypothetical protein